MGRITLLIILIFNTFTTIANASDYDKAKELFGKATEARYIEGDCQKSISLLTEALELSPEHAEDILPARASDYAKIGNYKMADADYDKIINSSKTEWERHYKIGKKYWAYKKYTKALTEFNEAITLNPSIAAYYNSRGTIYSILKKYEEANSDYTKAIQIEPDSWMFYGYRANLHSKMGMNKEALEDQEMSKQLKLKEREK